VIVVTLGVRSMLNQQTEEPKMNRFETLCAEVGEYDHLPAVSHEHDYPTQMITAEDAEGGLDASILAGLVSP
jgi:hypothetical protein